MVLRTYCELLLGSFLIEEVDEPVEEIVFDVELLDGIEVDGE
jgi:hypothetical protein